MACFHDGCINEAHQRVTYGHGAGGTDTFSDLCDGHLPAADAPIPAPYTSREVGPIPEPEPEPVVEEPVEVEAEPDVEVEEPDA